MILSAVLTSISLFGCGGGGGNDGGTSPTLIAGFPAGFPDTIRPIVSDTSPENLDAGVTLNSSVSVTFSEPMNSATLQAGSFTLQETAGGAPVSGAVVASGNFARIVPSANLTASTQYTATVTTAVRDVAGNAMAADFTWTFTTGVASDSTPPTVSATSPANGATGVTTNSSVSATFSEAMTNSTLNLATFTVVSIPDGGVPPGTVTVNGNTARFTPSGALAPSTQYQATIAASATDAAGNPMGADFTWIFTTAVAPDTTPPSVVALSPANSATNVALNASVSATFSEAMLNSTLNTASFTLRPSAGGAALAGTVNVTGNTARFTPSASLAGSTQYTATVTTAVQDAAGNPLAADFTWRFTTAAAPDTRAPTVDTTSPANVATGVALTTQLLATFSEPMRASTLNSASFRLVKTTGGISVPGTVTVSANTATFTPTANLDPSQQYTATITTAALDSAGNALAANYNWTFLTGAFDLTPPTVFATSPTSGASGVALNTQVTATFTEAMTASTLNTSSFTLATSPGGVPVTGTVNVSADTATFVPSADLAAGTYTATITTAAQDAAGNALAANYAWSFTTVSAPVTTATLDWDAVTANNFSGYRVYYGTAPGTYNQAPGAGINVGNVLTYTVTGLTSGTYYFAVTAFDSSNNESDYSNEVSKIIP
jgi:hypothetical protein